MAKYTKEEMFKVYNADIEIRPANKRKIEYKPPAGKWLAKFKNITKE